MKLHHILFISTVLLIILNILLILKNREYKKELFVKINECNYANETAERLENMVSLLYKKSFYTTNKDSLYNLNPDLYELLKSGDRIICYMQKDVCRSCIFRLLQDLAILEEKIGTGKVLFASNLGTKNKPFEIKEFNFPTFFINSFNFPNELSKEPILFILDKQMNIKLFFLPELFPEFKDKYFKEILPDYFRKTTKSFKENIQLQN